VLCALPPLHPAQPEPLRLRFSCPPSLSLSPSRRMADPSVTAPAQLPLTCRAPSGAFSGTLCPPLPCDCHRIALLVFCFSHWHLLFSRSHCPSCSHASLGSRPSVTLPPATSSLLPHSSSPSTLPLRLPHSPPSALLLGCAVVWLCSFRRKGAPTGPGCTLPLRTSWAPKDRH